MIDQQKAVQQMVKKTLTLVVITAVLLVAAFFRPGQARHLTSPLGTKQTLHLDGTSPEIMQTIEMGSSMQKTFDSPEVTELKRKINVEESKNLSSKPIVYAFLPYRNINDDLKVNSNITDLSYFRLLVDESGLIQTEEIVEESDQGALVFESERWQELAHKWQVDNPEGRLEVTFFQDDAQALEQLLVDEVARDTFVMSLHQFLDQHPEIKGINLDFEYYGTGGEAMQKGMTTLLKKIRLLIAERHPGVRLSVDVFGRAGYKSQGIYDWAEVAKQVDYVVLMAYDYKTRSSSVPGPVSPTLGKEVWGADIFDSLRALLQKVPSYQVILAVPFYGYQWETTSTDLAEAKTYPETGRTVTYKKIADLLVQAEDLGVTVGWDQHSLTPYFTYEADSKKYIAFYENAQSLGYKMDLLKGMNLGGVAVWSLGYEGDKTELWDVIKERLP